MPSDVGSTTDDLLFRIISTRIEELLVFTVGRDVRQSGTHQDGGRPFDEHASESGAALFVWLLAAESCWCA